MVPIYIYIQQTLIPSSTVFLRRRTGYSDPRAGGPGGLNLKWDLTCATEGGYLDLFLMIKDCKVEWKTFTKTPPLYLNRISCHDPKVFQGISTGVGYRLRLTNSTNETFRENVAIIKQSHGQFRI